MKQAEIEKYRRYAWQITHETFKAELRSKWRRERLGHDPKRWLKADGLSARNFVKKILKIVESWE